MRVTRMVTAGVLSLTVMIAPATVAAQSADTEPPDTPSYWTSTEIMGPGFAVSDTDTESFPWGYRQTLGLTYDSRSDDPRAAGHGTIVYVLDWSDEYDLGRGTGLVRLVNDGGSFEGPLHVVYYPDGSEFRLAIMEGRDGYEGLTFTMTNYLDPSGIGQPQGLIWEGEMPSLPDAELLPD